MARSNDTGPSKRRPPQLIDLAPPKQITSQDTRRRKMTPPPQLGGQSSHAHDTTPDHSYRDQDTAPRRASRPEYGKHETNPIPRTYDNTAPRSQPPSYEDRLKPRKIRAHPSLYPPQEDSRGQKPPRRGGKRPTPGTRPGQGRRKKTPKMHPFAKKMLHMGITVLVIGGLLAMLLIHAFSNNALAVYLDGVHFGYMTLNRETTSESFHDEVIAHIESFILTEVVTSQRVTIAPARWVSGRNIDNRGEIISDLGVSMEYDIMARAIYLNNVLEVIVRSDNCVSQIERAFMEAHRNENTVHQEFVNDWRVVPVRVHPNDEVIMSSMHAAHILDRQELTYYRYIVQPGDYLVRIARRFETTPEVIAQINNMSSTRDIIHPGDALMVRARRPLLTVRSIEEFVSEESIEMPVETIYTNERAEGTTHIVQDGRNGERRVTLRITFENDVERYRETLDAEIIREPLMRIVEVGTRPAQIERR